VIGEWSAEGYGIGLMDTMKKITPNINNSLSGVGVSGGAGGGITFGTNSIQLNFYGAQDTASVRKGVSLGIADALRARGSR